MYCVLLIPFGSEMIMSYLSRQIYCLCVEVLRGSEIQYDRLKLHSHKWNHIFIILNKIYLKKKETIKVLKL